MKNFELTPEENSEPISKKDMISEEEKGAFTEMQRQIELGKSDISEDLISAEEVEKIIESLPEDKQKDVIRRIHLNGEKNIDVAKSLGLGQSRIHQIEMKALRLLRHPKRIQLIKEIELKSRSKDNYPEVLHSILRKYLYSLKNKKLEKVLREIDFLTWGATNRKGFDELDSLTFNQICDDLKNILDKKDYNEQDIEKLQNISKKIKRELR